MSVLRRRLLMGGGRGRYVDEFAALSGRWLPQAGSLAVAGGALQAATLGDWLGNRIDNGEFTDDPPRWGPFIATTTVERVDSTLDPGVDSGGADKWCLKVTEVTADDYGAARPIASSAPTIVGATFRGSVRAYVPSSNVFERAAHLRLRGLYMQIGAEDAWVTIANTIVTIDTAAGLMCTVRGTGDGNVGYFDSVEYYRRNAPALLAGWRSPNHVATLGIVNPATAVTPFGYICRYTDSLNYWEVRVLPNTEGNDLQIIQVTAGAETTRAEADVDWTSDDTDELEVMCAGSTISTAYRKAGAGVWTAGPSYASATQGQTSPNVGVMLYETGVGRLAGFEIRAL